MRILQINNVGYRRGGADVVFLNTIELLKKRGHKVVSVAGSAPEGSTDSVVDYSVGSADFFTGNIAKRILKAPSFIFSIPVRRFFKKLLDDNEFDVAHIHSYKGVLSPSILYELKKRDIPVVFTLHDYGLLCPHNTFLDGRNNICTRCLDSGRPVNAIIHKCNRNNFAYSFLSYVEYVSHRIFFPFHRYITALIPVSDFIASLHAREPKLASKQVRIYNFMPSRAPINRRLPHSRSRVGARFLFAGRLAREKGVSTLLGAWSSLGRNDCELVIAGNGPMLTYLKAFVSENNLSNVEFLGHLDRDELETEIASADFVVVPSEWYENNPLAIIEAFSLGKPVIGSNIGGIPEMICSGENGYLFEAGSQCALENSLKVAANLDPDTYRHMSESALNVAKDKFGEDSHYKQLISLYLEVTAKNLAVELT